MSERGLTLSVLPEVLAIGRQPVGAALPTWLHDCSFWSVTRTADELSLVVPEAYVPPERFARVERGWRALKVRGPLDFGLTGVLAGLSGALADAGVSVFAISTYDTDYLLVRDADLERAVAALSEAGYRL